MRSFYLNTVYHLVQYLSSPRVIHSPFFFLGADLIKSCPRDFKQKSKLAKSLALLLEFINLSISFCFCFWYVSHIRSIIYRSDCVKPHSILICGTLIFLNQLHLFTPIASKKLSNSLSPSKYTCFPQLQYFIKVPSPPLLTPIHSLFPTCLNAIKLNAKN